MGYLNETVSEMKAKIMTVCQYVKNAKTQQEVTRYTDKLEEYIKGKLLESFKNGIEVSNKKRGSKR